MSRPAQVLTIESCPIPMWTMQPDGTVAYVNPAWECYAGDCGEDDVHTCWMRSIHPDDIESFRERWGGAAESGDACDIEYRLRRADGSYRWHLARIAPLPDTSAGWMGTAIDIEDRWREEARLRASEARFRDIVETAGDIVYSLSLDSTITAVNPAVEQILGYTPEELLGRSIEGGLIPADQLEVSLEARRRKLQGEDRSAYALEVVAKDGRRVTLEINSRLARVDGRPVAIHGIARDITARVQSEAGLRVLAEAGRLLTSDLDVEARLAAVADLAVPALADWCVVDLLENGPDLRRVAVAHVDPAKRAMAEELQRRYPPDPEAAQGPYHVMRTGRSELVASIPDVLLVAAAHDDEHLQLLRGVGFRSYLTVPLEARGRVLGTLTFIAAESGRSYGAVDLAIAEALAERAALAIDNARLYRSAQEAEARYRKVFTGVADAILVADINRRYLDANPAATDLLGFSRDELLAMRVEDVVVDAPAWTEAEYARYVNEGRWEGELQLRRSDGTTVPVEALATVIELSSGPMYLSAVRDVSERHRLERLRRDFLAMVTHDLRTPLTSIRGNAQLLKRHAEYRATRVEAILTSTFEMQRLINDLADVVQLESGFVTLRKEPVDLVAVANEVADDVRAAFDDVRLTIVAPPIPVVSMVDRGRVKQVLMNLVQNAYTHARTETDIEIHVKDEDNEARVMVVDQGPGIAPEQVSRLFDQFYRADVTGSGGLGLGLYISRMLVEAHGGCIWVESKVGRGSTFIVALPDHA